MTQTPHPTRPARTRPACSWLGAALWVASGLCFVVTAFVPWVEFGLLSRSSPVDLAGLVRSGVLASAPAWIPWLVVVMPLVGAVLVGSAAFARLWLLRLPLLILATVFWAGILREVGGTAPDGWALGAWTGAAGVVLGSLGSVTEAVGRRLE